MSALRLFGEMESHADLSLPITACPPVEATRALVLNSRVSTTGSSLSEMATFWAENAHLLFQSHRSAILDGEDLNDEDYDAMISPPGPAATTWHRIGTELKRKIWRKGVLHGDRHKVEKKTTSKKWRKLVLRTD